MFPLSLDFFGVELARGGGIDLCEFENGTEFILLDDAPLFLLAVEPSPDILKHGGSR